MQRWTKWLHTTKAITRISVDLFHSKRPLDYPSRHMYEAHIHITGHPTKQPDSQSFLLLLKWVVILFLLFLMFFFSPPFVFQPNPRVLKTVLENIPRRLQPSFKKREKKRKKKGRHVGCCYFAMESNRNQDLWNEFNKIGGSMDAILVFFLLGDICLFLVMLSGVDCSHLVWITYQ